MHWRLRGPAEIDTGLERNKGIGKKCKEGGGGVGYNEKVPIEYPQHIFTRAPIINNLLNTKSCPVRKKLLLTSQTNLVHRSQYPSS